MCWCWNEIRYFEFVVYRVPSGALKFRALRGYGWSILTYNNFRRTVSLFECKHGRTKVKAHDHPTVKNGTNLIQKSRKPSATFTRKRFRLRNLNKCSKSYIECYTPAHNRQLSTLTSWLPTLSLNQLKNQLKLFPGLLTLFPKTATLPPIYGRSPVHRFYRR